MRWQGQLLRNDSCGELGSAPHGSAGAPRPGEPQALPGLEATTFLRSVATPDFAGVTFHEVLCRSALNKVTKTSTMPFGWTINPMRGCSHACVYCFARTSHEYLDLDPGEDFDKQIIVKTNLVEVLRRELRRPSWAKEAVAMGTNTDPYQRAEGRYRLMPGVIEALSASGTSFSILTKGTLLRRDLPVLAEAATRVRVHLSVSIALVDEPMQQSLEPGTPTPKARMELVRAIREAGFSCGVMAAPILPGLTDSREHLDQLVKELTAAGATSISAFPLHLRPGTRGWFMSWLEREHPELVPRYKELYPRGSYITPAYREWLSQTMAPILRRHQGRRPVSARHRHRGPEGPQRQQAAPAVTPEPQTLF
ncbi:Radical SAM domain protein [Segniliparus rotundus DSM 44985]|uniref:Radical SAM domain protein n=1 Tax=Segniliparus rotundus (strain ATCC BAA-972 / CDC 1076 / CIP 108378 / DSM 44985 / JCM 13578) TaxID=640132 RepID=D6Z7J5_SEGRD|nr:Rv2578c family radical SAM protein [Segniliparus rotundus]ADG97925.1 Radical SAM domain protein [Segniliparus rotundus DSM 44985]